MEEYKPKIIEEDEHLKSAYGEVLVELTKCSICGKYMLDVPKGCCKCFPSDWHVNIEQQMKSVGWVLKSYIKVNDDYICKECAEAGKATFECSLCHERYPTTDIKEQFGDPPDYLCIHCYANVTAEVWQKKVDELYEEHKYDFD